LGAPVPAAGTPHRSPHATGRSVLHTTPARGIPLDAYPGGGGGGAAVTRTAWTLFFPALLVAIVSKVTGFVLGVMRGTRNLLRFSAAKQPFQHTAEEERRRNLHACQRVAMVGIGANLLLVVMQAITGLLGNSAGLIAKAVDSFGDLMGDAISFLSIRKAHQPPDASHQFGHGKFESVGALSIATLLLVAAWEAGTESLEALERTWEDTTIAGPSMFALYGALASVVIKEALYRVMMAVGKATKSDSTIANANHHRMDGFASGIVVIGILGGRLGFRFADPIAGILVAAIIVKAAYDIAAEALNDLTDGIPNLGDIDLPAILQDAVDASHGVLKYDNLRARKMGPFIALQMDLVVDPTLTIPEVAAVEERVTRQVLRANESITEVGFRILPALSPTMGSGSAGTAAPVPAMA